VPTSKLVLVVDDIPDHASLYTTALERRGYRVQLARTGIGAKAAARNEPPDCIVMDVRLPDVDGWDLCREMKAEPQLKLVRIIVLTSEVTKKCAEDSTRSGCQAWLARPTLAQDIVRAVDHVMAASAHEPESAEEAMLGVTTCIACGSDQIRATLRFGSVQYYCCNACSLCWRSEGQPA
jgi:CheY-like chemotaxis protein